jgi:hypothetical protein
MSVVAEVDVSTGATPNPPEPENTGGAPSGGETYVGRYSGYLIDSHPHVSWEHSLDINFTVTVTKDGSAVHCMGVPSTGIGLLS